MPRDIVYKSPEVNLHRSFVYLDDELVVNSLSALEAGKIDSVVTKINEARESGFGGSVSASALAVKGNAEAGKKKQSSFEDELIRIRTKFSIFEAWYQYLIDNNAVGDLLNPNEWQQAALRIGEVIKLEGKVKTYEIYPLARMYSDYAKSTKLPGHPWYIKGEGAKKITQSAEIMRHVFGAEGEMQIPARVDLSEKAGDIAFILGEEKLLGSPAPLEGEYTVVGQVAEILEPGDWSPTLRLMPKAPKNEFERSAVIEMLSNFEEASAQFGVRNVGTMGEFTGPALILEPIAIFR
ncbi:hypothetical protein M3A76_06090 [Corynebacterium sanguinis]|uniref:DUF6414 family protein n=2 Tax=Corynebacterium sanguinis TaxID=2594913 RepID=UPI001185773D|nr:hypothetical protein [Corynebacterium sanguinis]MCT1425201.1 hypothetical protein [Corynebacterium sanguinis]MCT1613819.1 hypothetical protein [Corynebacterium sanguinis]MCT1663656.1 hypothetical protein [Corynebacterium sanguinis]MCT1694661.1 hypothetical protein [Corynebacterium sanguinis]MCT1714404.1 hypothetical protein [Corynebacterium sanguinis]